LPASGAGVQGGQARTPIPPSRPDRTGRSGQARTPIPLSPRYLRAVGGRPSECHGLRLVRPPHATGRKPAGAAKAGWSDSRIVGSPRWHSPPPRRATQRRAGALPHGARVCLRPRGRGVPLAYRRSRLARARADRPERTGEDAHPTISALSPRRWREAVRMPWAADCPSAARHQASGYSTRSDAAAMVWSQAKRSCALWLPVRRKEMVNGSILRAVW
jgi:hypothetical protein